MNSVASPALPPVSSLRVGLGLCAAVGLLGLGLGYAVEREAARGRMREALIAGGMAAFLVLGAAIMAGGMRRYVARQQDLHRRAAEFPDEPWRWRAEWVDPRGMAQSAGRYAGIGLVAGIALWLMSAPAMLAFQEEWRRGNHGIGLALIFPLVGTLFLVQAGLARWRRGKYGVARFLPAILPVPLGGVLAGVITVPRRVEATGPGRVVLECWLSTETRSSRSSAGKRRRTELIEATTERVVGVEEWAAGFGGSRLPIELPVRGGAATTFLPASLEAAGREWRLRIEVPTAGADFVAEFVVPVFGVAVAMRNTPPPEGRALASAWQAAEVRVEAQPGVVGGEALVLPKGAGGAAGWVPTVYAVVFIIGTGFVWVYGPWLLALVLSLVTWLVASCAWDFWNGGGERVWVEADGVHVLRGGVQRVISRYDVAAVEVSRSTSVGNRQCYTVVGRRETGRSPRFTPVLGLVRSEEAAAAAVAWLEERLTRDAR